MNRTWNLETITCAFTGHHTAGVRAAPEQSSAEDRSGTLDAALAIDLGDGRSFERCTRCDAWIEVAGAVPSSAVLPEHRLVDPAKRRSQPARGRELRALAVQRAGAVWFAVQVLILLLGGFVAVLLALHLPRAKADARGLLARIGRDTEAGRIVAQRLTELLAARPQTLRVAALVLTAAAVLAAGVVVGLWLGSRWGAYLAVLTTAAFTAGAVAIAGAAASPAVVAAIDVVFAAWLIVDRRLFGVRGGVRALTAGRGEAAGPR